MKHDLVKLAKELENELKTNILSYWIKNAVDNMHGGFKGQIDHNNRPVPEAPRGAVMNARILWTFSEAYGMFGQEEYMHMARRAYDYILNHFFDEEYGGVYWELDFKGKVSRSRKQVYALAFVVYGLSSYYGVTGDKNALERAIELFRIIEKYSLDPAENGYIEAFTRDWQALNDFRLSYKDLNEPKTLNTHLHILEAHSRLFMLWKNKDLEQALLNLVRLFIDRFIDPVSGHLNLFFDAHWRLRSDRISYGHDIEISWLLYEAAVITANKELKDRIAEISVRMAEKNMEALDEDYGLFNESFPGENRIDTDKHWWPQAEAMVGYFNAWQLSGAHKFINAVLRTWNFIKNYMIDWSNGEWFWRVNREGVPYTEDEKVGFWKGPYHNGRMCMELIRRIKGLRD